ncbi:MAG: HU family DNA-binding protein [Gammaproteobacteria bacterium]
MSYTKSDIAKNIADRTSLPNQKAKQLLDKFIQVVVSGSKKQQVKISGFGTFIRKETPSRIGRNPKTGEEFEISKRTKLNLILSNKIKEKIN